MRCLVMGHLVVDRIVKGSKMEKRIGGGAYYSSMVLSQFCDVELMTSIGEDFPEEWLRELREAGIVLRILPARVSTSYELKYLDGNRRELQLLSVAEKIEPSPPEWEYLRDFDLVILNPVASEISSELAGTVIRESKRVALDLQGFIRSPSPGPVEFKPVDGSFMKGAFVVHADSSEFGYLRNLSPDSVHAMVISRGPEPGTVYFRGRPYLYIPKGVKVAESTGAGDVFLASFSYFLTKCPFLQALKRASAFTALFLERRNFEVSMDEVNDVARLVEVRPLKE